MSDDWRLRLGWVCPSVFFEYGYEKILPDGARLMTVTTASPLNEKVVYADDPTDDDLADAEEQAERAATVLDERGVDCIVGGGTPVFSKAGTEAEDRFIDEMNATFSAPYVTANKALVNALRALNAESVLVVTPYPHGRNRERKAYLEDRGLEVVSIGGFGESSLREAARRPGGDYYRRARELAAGVDRDFDAVCISCAALQVEDHIAPLEQDMGRPVVTSVQSYVWNGFELAGIDPAIDGYGQLFDV